MNEWLAWVDVPDDPRVVDGPTVRMYVTHGIPFLQLTAFRSAGARYATCDTAQTIAGLAAGAAWAFGAEKAPESLAPRRRERDLGRRPQLG